MFFGTLATIRTCKKHGGGESIGAASARKKKQTKKKHVVDIGP